MSDRRGYLGNRFASEPAQRSVDSNPNRRPRTLLASRASTRPWQECVLRRPIDFLLCRDDIIQQPPHKRQPRHRRFFQGLHHCLELALSECRSADPAARELCIVAGRPAHDRTGRAPTSVGVASATVVWFAAPTGGDGPRSPFWRPPLAGIGMRTAYLTSATLALLLSSACGSADAFGGLILIDSPPSDGYSLSIGPGVAGFRDRRGRKDTKVVPVPGVDFYSSTGGFASTDVGLGWNFSRREDIQFGVRFWPIFERSRTTSQRPDHSDTRTRIAKGVFLNYAPWQFLILQSNLLAGYATSGDRIQAEVGATAGLPLGDRGLVGVTLGTTWSNGPYMRNSFGVSQRESARDGLPVYSPGGGWSDINLQLSGEFQLDERWRVSGEVVKAHLIGGAGRSPSVASRNVGTFSLTIWYRFK